MSDRPLLNPEIQKGWQYPVYAIWPVMPDSIMVIDSRQSLESFPRAQMMVKNDLITFDDETAFLKNYFSQGKVDMDYLDGLKANILLGLWAFRPELPQRGIVEFTFWKGPFNYYFQSKDWSNIYNAINDNVDLSRVNEIAKHLLTQEQHRSIR